MGTPHTEEHKKYMSEIMKGRKFTAEHKANMSKSRKGKKAWNKGVPMPQHIKEALLKSHLGVKLSEETKKKMSEGHKGKKQTPEHVEKRTRRGEQSHNWKGGITPINTQIRNSVEYRLWRQSVFARDKYTCVWCGDCNYEGRGKTIVLQADHIKPFAQYPELRFAIDNGRTLCLPCHKTTESYGRPTKNI